MPSDFKKASDYLVKCKTPECEHLIPKNELFQYCVACLKK